MADNTNKCAHPACSCPVEKGEKYCSQYCKDAGSTMEIACNCGHTGCGTGEQVPAMHA
jgi:hypothetical protein